MHAIFIPYGIKSAVEHMLRDMEAEKFPIFFYKNDEKKMAHVQGSVRLLPGGVYEYVFPETSKDLVLTTLRFHEVDKRYTIPKMYLKILKKVLRAEDIPKFNADKKLLWVTDNVAIIPIGIRTDAIVTAKEDGSPFAGYEHEAL